MEGSMRVRKQRDEKERMFEGSMKIRKQKDEKDKLIEGSMRKRKQKEDKIMTGSMRIRKQKDDKDIEASERRRKVNDKDDEKLKFKDGRRLSSNDSSRRIRKGAASFRRRVMKIVSTFRQKGKDSPDVDAKEKMQTSNHSKCSASVPTEAQKAVFEIFVKEVFEMGVDGLLKEYAILKPYLASNYSREIFDQNPTKNRYKDVICNDMTRVSIRDGKGSDYIHANYVKSEYLQNTFICTQGPMLSTIHDFWRMVVSEHVSHIIMLCETIEQGKMKCEQYWPTAQEGKMNVEEFLLTNVKISCNDNHVLRTTIEVQIGNSGARQLVKHHQWKTWPDKTVPKSLLAVFRILQMVRSTSNPIVVHCSAGVGRTGSMMSLNIELNSAADQRMHSVQVEVQYVFVAEAICEYGRAMGYWDDPKLHEQYAKFKAVFEEYVARLPQPAAVAAAAAQQAALALNAATQNQQNAPVIPSPAPIVAVAPQQNIPAIPTPTNAQYPYPGIIQGPQYFAMPKPSAAPVDTTRGVPMTADLMRVAQTAAEFLRPQPANIVQPTNAEQTRAHQPVPAPLRAPQAAPCGLPRAPQSSAEQVRAQQTVPGPPRAPTLSGIPPVPQMATPAPKPSVQSAVKQPPPPAPPPPQKTAATPTTPTSPPPPPQPPSSANAGRSDLSTHSSRRVKKKSTPAVIKLVGNSFSDIQEDKECPKYQNSVYISR